MFILVLVEKRLVDHLEQALAKIDQSDQPINEGGIRLLKSRKL